MTDDRKEKPMTPVSTVAFSLQERLDALKRRAAEMTQEEADRFKPNCERCGDTKWIIVEDQGTRRARRCPTCVEGAAEVGAPSVPYEFRGAMLSNYDALPGNASATRAAKAWLERTSGDLYLHGGVGSGKTRLACSILNEYYRRHRVGMFTRVSGMLFSLQPKEDNAHERFWTRLVENPVIVLDDIGAEREDASDFSRRMVLQLYEERGDRGYRTIWTSNKTLGELSEQLGDERLVSRIAGRAEIVKLTTADQRLRRR